MAKLQQRVERSMVAQVFVPGIVLGHPSFDLRVEGFNSIQVIAGALDNGLL